MGVLLLLQTPDWSSVGAIDGGRLFKATMELPALPHSALVDGNDTVIGGVGVSAVVAVDSLPFHGLGVRILRGPPILACVPTDLCLSTDLDPTSISAADSGGACAEGWPDLCVMDMGWLAIDDRALIGSTREDEEEDDGLGDGELTEVEGDGVGSVGVLGLVASGLTTFEGWGWTRAIFF